MLNKRFFILLFLPLLSGFGQQNAPLIFHRVTEPNEQAFTLLIPKVWITEGGIFRVNPTAQGGAGQSIAAKLDFTIKKYPGLNHLFQASTTGMPGEYAMIEETISPLVLSDILNWLNARFQQKEKE